MFMLDQTAGGGAEPPTFKRRGQLPPFPYHYKDSFENLYSITTTNNALMERVKEPTTKGLLHRPPITGY